MKITYVNKRWLKFSRYQPYLITSESLEEIMADSGENFRRSIRYVESYEKMLRAVGVKNKAVLTDDTVLKNAAEIFQATMWMCRFTELKFYDYSCLHYADDEVILDTEEAYVFGSLLDRSPISAKEQRLNRLGKLLRTNARRSALVKSGAHPSHRKVVLVITEEAYADLVYKLPKWVQFAQDVLPYRAIVVT